MPRFNAPPPNGDSRKAIEQRAREASRPAVPQNKERWPFSAAGEPAAGGGEENPAVNAGKAGMSGSSG